MVIMLTMVSINITMWFEAAVGMVDVKCILYHILVNLGAHSSSGLGLKAPDRE